MSREYLAYEIEKSQQYRLTQIQKWVAGKCLQVNSLIKSHKYLYWKTNMFYSYIFKIKIYFTVSNILIWKRNIYTYIKYLQIINILGRQATLYIWWCLRACSQNWSFYWQRDIRCDQRFNGRSQRICIKRMLQYRYNGWCFKRHKWVMLCYRTLNNKQD